MFYENDKVLTGAEKLSQVNAERDAKIEANTAEQTARINEVDDFFKKQQDAAQAYADEQTKLQKEQSALTIQQINNQKDQAKKDYAKEQSAAYVDWQKQSGDYGVNAEQMAAQGMTNTGYSESSKVSMYNTYQNRVATATESYNNAITNYNTAIATALLQNSSTLATIAYQALQSQLQLSLEGFQYKNSLIDEMNNREREIRNDYHGYYMDVLDQMNQEAALKGNNIPLIGDHAGTTPVIENGVVPWDADMSETNRNNITAMLEQQEENESGDVVVDMASIEALGFGNMTEERLDNYIRRGFVEDYIDGGKIKYRLTPAGAELRMNNSDVDQKSIENLGIPGVANSPKLLEQYIATGIVERYMEDGVVKYRLTELGKQYSRGNYWDKNMSKKNQENFLKMLDTAE